MIDDVAALDVRRRLRLQHDLQRALDAQSARIARLERDLRAMRAELKALRDHDQREERR